MLSILFGSLPFADVNKEAFDAADPISVKYRIGREAVVADGPILAQS
jgi:hypothetical protein